MRRGLDEIATDRPMLIAAEGLVMYLTEPEAGTLLQRLTDRFGSGELVFDTLSLMGPRLSKVFTKASSRGVSMTLGKSSNGTHGCTASSRPLWERSTNAYPRRRGGCCGGCSSPRQSGITKRAEPLRVLSHAGSARWRCRQCRGQPPRPGETRRVEFDYRRGHGTARREHQYQISGYRSATDQLQISSRIKSGK